MRAGRAVGDQLGLAQVTRRPAGNEPPAGYDQQQPSLHALIRICLVAMVNAANRLGVIMRQKGGSYEPGMLASWVS